MSPRARRLVRGWAGAGLATSAAAASHTVAGGQPPPALLLLLSLALSGPLCMALAGRALSRTALALSVLLSQSLFHALFAAAGTVGAVTDASHHGAAGTGAALVLQAASPPGHGGPVMPAAHVLAALAGYALMRHGEVAVLVLLEALRLRVRSLWRSLSSPVVAGRPRAVRPGRPHALTDQSLLRPVRSHRGPPRPRRRLPLPAGPAPLPVG
ncbi:hypothetical protein [Kocuria sp. KH4]